MTREQISIEISSSSEIPLYFLTIPLFVMGGLINTPYLVLATIWLIRQQ